MKIKEKTQAVKGKTEVISEKELTENELSGVTGGNDKYSYSGQGGAGGRSAKPVGSGGDGGGGGAGGGSGAPLSE